VFSGKGIASFGSDDGVSERPRSLASSRSLLRCARSASPSPEISNFRDDERRLRVLLVAVGIYSAAGVLGGVAAADHAGDSKVDSNVSVAVNDGGYFGVL